jgi:hypothetical protein
MHCLEHRCETPLEAMYGERLREIKKRYDPEDVMGLAGGWKFDV